MYNSCELLRIPGSFLISWLMMVKFSVLCYKIVKIFRVFEMLAIMLCLSNYELAVNSKKLFADFSSGAYFK